MLYLSLACGAASLVLTKSAVLNGLHSWLEKRSPFVGEMLSCPWCTSHWVALGLVLAFGPVAIGQGWLAWLLAYPVSVFALVALSTATMRFMYSTIKSLE